MKSNLIVTLMTNLIQKKFYKTKEEAVSKLDVYFALGKISDEEYVQLSMLAEQSYMEEVI